MSDQMGEGLTGFYAPYCERCKTEHPEGHHWHPIGKVRRPNEARGSWPRCSARYEDLPGPYTVCIFASHRDGFHCARQPDGTGMSSTLLWWE